MKESSPQPPQLSMEEQKKLDLLRRHPPLVEGGKNIALALLEELLVQESDNAATKPAAVAKQERLNQFAKFVNRRATDNSEKEPRVIEMEAPSQEEWEQTQTKKTSKEYLKDDPGSQLLQEMYSKKGELPG